MNNSSQHGFSSKINRRSKAEKIALIINETTHNSNHKKRWLLDVGTGNGEIADYLSNDFNVISIDVKDQRSFKDNFHFLISNESLPFRSNLFDIVISNHVIEHVHNPKHHIDEIYRVLNQQGWLYLATPNRLWPWEVHYRVPLAHYLPNKAFYWLMKKTGKYQEDIDLKTSWQLKSLCKQFSKIYSLSENICQQPRHYQLNVSEWLNQLLSKTPKTLFVFAHLFMPTFVFMLQKDKPIKKILWLSSSYPRFEDDNASIFLRLLAENINKHSFEIHILSPDHESVNLSFQESVINNHRFRYFCPRSQQKLAYGSGILPNLKNNKLLFFQVPFFLTAMFISLFSLSRKIKPDLIHAHWIIPQGFIAVIVGKILKIPVIVTAHGGDAFSLNNSLLNRLKKITIKNCSRWTSNTSATAKAFGNTSNLPQPIYIPMGVNIKHFRSGDANKIRNNDDRQIILFVGRLVEKKGVQYLLDAYAQLPVSIQKESVLWIIGDGSERIKLEQQAKQLSIVDSIIFWGQIKNEQLPNFYAAASLFIVPSIIDSQGDTEGQGVILLEAMATKTPIIATITGGIPEIITHNKTGLLVRPNNSQELSDTIQFLLNNRVLSENLAEQAFQKVNQLYDWNCVSQRFISAYKNI